jgi:hypothetical protein
MTLNSLRPLVSTVTLALVMMVCDGTIFGQPQSGQWKVKCDLGEFTLTVAAGGTSITKIAYNYINWKCGPITVSGGVTVMSSWSITNNQFSITRNMNPNFLGESWPLTINGTFTAAGDQVSGTWNANIAGTLCSGSWGPVGLLVFVREDMDVPEQIALQQNYPNPFNPSTTIQYALPFRSHITLAVYNTLGQIVKELVNGEMGAGFHSVEFAAKGLPSGVYFYRMRAGDFVQTKRLLVLK